jgi:hypothetical protein
MAIIEWELWAVANEMIRQHGRRAIIEATLKMTEMQDKGDRAGAETWFAILERIMKLLKDKPDGPVN